LVLFGLNHLLCLLAQHCQRATDFGWFSNDQGPKLFLPPIAIVGNGVLVPSPGAFEDLDPKMEFLQPEGGLRLKKYGLRDEIEAGVDELQGRRQVSFGQAIK
jgi:hypothetical protein